MFLVRLGGRYFQAMKEINGKLMWNSYLACNGLIHSPTKSMAPEKCLKNAKMTFLKQSKKEKK